MAFNSGCYWREEKLFQSVKKLKIKRNSARSRDIKDEREKRGKFNITSLRLCHLQQNLQHTKKKRIKKVSFLFIHSLSSALFFFSTFNFYAQEVTLLQSITLTFSLTWAFKRNFLWQLFERQNENFDFFVRWMVYKNWIKVF